MMMENSLKLNGSKMKNNFVENIAIYALAAFFYQLLAMVFLFL